MNTVFKASNTKTIVCNETIEAKIYDDLYIEIFDNNKRETTVTAQGLVDIALNAHKVREDIKDDVLKVIKDIAGIQGSELTFDKFFKMVIEFNEDQFKAIERYGAEALLLI